jgi:Cu/Ag efflux protein CusF
MKIAIPLLAVALAIAPASSASAASHAREAVAAAPSWTDAEVRKVDRDAGKITLRHQEIRSLEMPPMTMVFVVKDRAMLDQVKQGDPVRFAAEKVGGILTVTALEPRK